jgi:hypothetical protein
MGILRGVLEWLNNGAPENHSILVAGHSSWNNLDGLPSVEQLKEIMSQDLK